MNKSDNESDSFKIKLGVRDYECDLQGRVNNGVYFNYFEHARHEYLKKIGFDFKDLVTQGIHLVAVRVEIDYLKSLYSGQSIMITANLNKLSRVKYIFNQSIYRKDELIAEAKIYAVALNEEGKPINFKKLDLVLNEEKN